MKLGGTCVVQDIPLSELHFLDIGTIRKAIKNRTPEDDHLIECLVRQSLSPVLQIVQAFMGGPIGITGTIGNPVIIEYYIQIFAEGLENTLVATLAPQYIFRPPLNNDESIEAAFADYLMRFTD